MQQPRVASHIRHLEVRSLQVLYENRQLRKSERTPYQRRVDMFSRAAHQGQCNSIDYDDWLSTVCYGEKSLLIAILLPLLPNLTTLELEWLANNLLWLDSMLAHVPRATFPVLRNLHSFILDGGGYDVYLANIRLCSYLPCLRSLSASPTKDSDDYSHANT